MSTQAVTPDVAASPSPVVADVSSAPETSTPSTPSTTESAASAPAVSAEPNQKDFEGDVQGFIDATIKYRTEQKQKASEGTQETTEEKSAEQLEAERIGAPGEPQAAAAAVPAEEVQAEATTEPFTLEEEGILTPKTVNDLLAANPEFKKLIDADPKLKGHLFKTARIAAESQKFYDLFPDISAAEYAVERSKVADTFDQLATTFETQKPGDFNSTKGFLTAIAEYSKDEAGNVGPDFAAFIDNIAEMNVNYLKDSATRRLNENVYRSEEEREKDQEFLAALEIVRERTSRSSSASDTQNLPENLKRQAAEIQRQKAELENRKQQEQQEARQRFEDTVVSDADKFIDSQIDSIFASVELPSFSAKAARNEIKEQVIAKLAENATVRSQMARLYALPPTEDSKKRRLEVGFKAVQSVLPNIARSVLKEAGAKQIDANKDKLNKIAAQTQRSQGEPKGSSAAALPGKPLTQVDAFNKALSQLKEQNPDADVRDLASKAMLMAAKMRSAGA